MYNTHNTFVAHPFRLSSRIMRTVAGLKNKAPKVRGQQDRLLGGVEIILP